ncbi:tol-pal system YbgF family protein [Pendulispora albinea]|uniref:PEGA domain-containing protein n=1 Tax=Pendulispora albinea TaxID=2741071 RepID=A0ABZ2LPH1_9BACT
MRNALCVSAVAVVSQLCTASPLFAQAPPDDLGRSRARAVAEEGDAQFAAGRCDRAIRLWKDAAKIFAAPTIDLRVAHCQALLGRVVDASATLESIVDTALAPDAPPAFVAAKAQAQKELPTLKARIATLTVERRTSNGTQVDEIRIDDEAVPLGRASYPIDPGRHRVRIRAHQGAEASDTWEQSIELEDGEKRTLSASTVLVTPPPGPRPARTVSFIVGGAGLALTGAGAILGIMALGDSKELERDCGPNRASCSAEHQSRIDSLKTKSLLADVFIGAGVVTLGVSGFLFWRSTQGDKAAPRLHITVTGRGALLEGRF